MYTFYMKLKAQLKSFARLIRDYVRTIGADDPERSIKEFNRLSGQGNSDGWRFDRDEIHGRP